MIFTPLLYPDYREQYSAAAVLIVYNAVVDDANTLS